MKMLAEDIKNGSFKSSYLLYGEEAYLRTQYKNRLKNALADPSDTMNFSRFEGKGINPAEIISLAETLPFFAERRLKMCIRDRYSIFLRPESATGPQPR